MKTTEISTTAPAFQTPHEQAKTKGKKKPATTTPATVAPKSPAKATKDAWGGRIGTRMSKINLVVINAGEKGATVPEVAKETKETPGIVSAQLSWHVTKGNAKRKEETHGDGKKVWRYFHKLA